MNKETREDLIIASAAKVHEDWCEQELEGFWKRAVEAKKTIENPGEALEKACFKGEQKRNEIFIDVAQMVSYESISSRIFTDFNAFKGMVNMGAIDVKRMVPRELSPEEIVAAGVDYKDGKENILRPFLKLSDASQKENLDAAIGAANVYVQLSEAGVSIQRMENDPEIRNLIGVAIHADWLKRNKEHPNDSLKVPYSQLDEWTQQQDLTVFGALLTAVKENPEKYAVQPVPGVSIPDYLSEEQAILESTNKRI